MFNEFHPFFSEVNTLLLQFFKGCKRPETEIPREKQSVEEEEAEVEVEEGSLEKKGKELHEANEEK